MTFRFRRPVRHSKMDTDFKHQLPFNVTQNTAVCGPGGLRKGYRTISGGNLNGYSCPEGRVTLPMLGWFARLLASAKGMYLSGRAPVLSRLSEHTYPTILLICCAGREPISVAPNLFGAYHNFPNWAPEYLKDTDFPSRHANPAWRHIEFTMFVHKRFS